VGVDSSQLGNVEIEGEKLIDNRLNGKKDKIGIF
jgi:hypothetical protein